MASKTPNKIPSKILDFIINLVFIGCILSIAYIALFTINKFFMHKNVSNINIKK